MPKYNLHQANLSMEITNGAKIDDELVLVKNIEKAKTGAGKEYYTATIANSKSRTVIKIWDIGDKLKSGDYIAICLTGQIHDRYGPQWKVRNYHKVDYRGDAGFDRITYKPDIESLYMEMVSYPYKNYTVKLLLDLFDRTFSTEFKRKPGSLTNHHQYPGGLVQHSYEVWKCAESLLKTFDIASYPKVNKDIMLFGALVHDISKVEEYGEKEDGTFYRHPVSSLNGNTANSAIMFHSMVNELIRQGHTLDPQVIAVIEHILLSHHLKREWGSPVPPLCMEAYFVAIADQISSKVANFAGGLEADEQPNEPMTSRCYYWGNERLYKVPSIDPDYGKEPKTLFD